MTSDKKRELLFNLNKLALTRIANSAAERGMSPDDVMLVCINVDDPAWTYLADHLMPGHDWQQYRDKGQKPVARGSVQKDSMVEMLSTFVPDLADGFHQSLPSGAFTVAVMDAGGASTFFLQIS